MYVFIKMAKNDFCSTHNNKIKIPTLALEFDLNLSFSHHFGQIIYDFEVLTKYK